MRNLIALVGEQFVGGGRAFDLAHVEDEVVLLKKFSGVRLDQRGCGALELLLDDAGGEGLEIGVGGPAAGELDEGVPSAGKRQLEFEADDAVVVVLDFPGKALAGFEDQGLKRLLDRRTLVADVGRGLLEDGFGFAGREDGAENVEADLFANVELDQDQDRSAQGRVGLGALLHLGGQVAGNVGADHGCDFAVHRAVLSTRYPVVSSRRTKLQAGMKRAKGLRARFYCPRSGEIGVEAVS